MTTAFEHHQLPNGLTVIAEPDDRAHTAAVGFFVKTGTRDEDKSLMGVSHFLEHMMFKGTARRSADDVNREFDELGANYNAYTSQENTVYYARLLPEYLPQGVDLFCDMLRPALRDDDFDMEKKVIIEEIGMYDDRPHWRLHDALLEHHFGDHPLSYRVLGTADSVGALTATQMRSYFEHWYSPDNITIAAAGRLDFDKLVADIKECTTDWQPTGAVREYIAPAHSGQAFSYTDPKLSRHYVAALSPAPCAQDDSRYTAAILCHMLGDDDGSRLYWALIDPGICDEADFSHQPMDQVGYYMAYASCDPDRAEQVERILLETIDQFVQTLESGELERTKNKLATEAVLHGENTGGRMRNLGGQWTYQKQYIPLAQEMELLMAVSMDDIRGLIAQMPFTSRTIVRLGPG